MSDDTTFGAKATGCERPRPETIVLKVKAKPVDNVTVSSKAVSCAHGVLSLIYIDKLVCIIKEEINFVILQYRYVKRGTFTHAQALPRK
jgi:hypothetical protein